MRPGIVRWLSELLASVLLIAAMSGLVALLNPHVPALYLLVLYLLIVLPVAVVWGTGLAAVSAVLSVAVYSYLFIPPIHSFEIADWRSAVALGVFLVTAVVVGGLAARLRRAAVESGRLSQELLSRLVDQDLLGSFRLGVLAGPFDEFSVDEGRSGADQGDEVGRVHGTPAVLR
jgi:K+-sensing histidine kinase KdpD